MKYLGSLDQSQCIFCFNIDCIEMSSLQECGYRLELPSHLVDQNSEVFMRKKEFFFIFYFWLVIFFEVCILSIFNREEDVVFGYVHFVNIECCILSAWNSYDICVKCTEMGVIWFLIPRGFVYMQILIKRAGQQGSSF